MSLRRCAPFSLRTSQQQQQHHQRRLLVHAIAAETALRRLCSSAAGGAGPVEDGVEQDIAAAASGAAPSEFERLRSSIHAGADAASVYSRPRGVSAAGGGGGAFEDPALAEMRATRLFIETVVDTDPLGGVHRPDYYRDPAAGFGPQHAPRNFAIGGAVDAHHPLSPLHYEMQYQGRAEAADHGGQELSGAASRMRAALLRSERGLGFHQGAQQFPSRGGGEGEDAAAQSGPVGGTRGVSERGSAIFAAAHRTSPDPNVQAFFDSAASPRLPRNVVASREQGAAAIDNSAGASSSALSWLDASTVAEHGRHGALDQQREQELELFRRLHGERDRERFEEARAELYAQNNPGYDVDRIEARAAGISTFRGLEPLVPPGPAGEAHRDLRQHGVPSEHSTYMEQTAANTTAAAPLLGEALTTQLATAAESRLNAAFREKEDAWRVATGRGRQNALVSDSGPDQRTQKLHKNDERLLHAAVFARNAYRESDAAFRAKSPYLQRNTADGVGHLLRTQFDRQRRQETLANGQQDPVERSTMHLGTPLREQVDERVRGRVNLRTHRPIEYYMPHPKASDMLLLDAHSDVQGFPLFSGRMFNTRLNPFEWDLFVRYRGHVAQRRALALQHGLEPRPNESIEERAARRLALDELCERTPFDAERYLVLDHGMSVVPATELRHWFGAYWLPSPSLAALLLGKTLDTGVHLMDEQRAGAGDGVEMSDTREHVLSARYISKLLTLDDFNARLQRTNIKDQLFPQAPEPQLLYKVSESDLRYFSPEQRALYDEYVQTETDRHVQRWSNALEGKRMLPAQYGGYAAPARHMKSYSNEVVTLLNPATGERTVAAAALVQQQINSAAAAAAPKSRKGGAASSSQLATFADASTLNAGGALVTLDGVRYEVEADSLRREAFVAVKTDAGAVLQLPEREWNALPELFSPAIATATERGGDAVAMDPNTHITNSTGLPRPYAYNRLNYVETQDALWEGRVAGGAEGWTTAVHPDGLARGMPVRARRVFVDPATGQRRYGDYARAVVDSYANQPFFNPEPREVSVRFTVGGGAEPVAVPLATTLIWQAAWGGAGRTERLTTRKLSLGLRRFVDMRDPKGEGKAQPHFLDRYLTQRQRSLLAARWRTTKSIADMDNFTVADMNRPHNHRLLSGTGVRHYLRSGFLHRYTPWEFILGAEAEAPLIHEQLRGADREGPSHFFAPNRFWRYKRRPYGYIQNHRDEVRDLFQYIDAITPWEAARQIRTHWEVREHHPMPAYFRPHNLHRNTAALLPTHLWESDKKTGKVKVLKDSLKDYKPLRVHPAWVNM